MTDRVTFDHFPPEHVRVAVCEWLHRHGIDSQLVSVPGWIERQVDRYRVAYESYVRCPDNRTKMNEAGDDAARENRYVQLEGPPLPWPGELARWLDRAAEERS